MTIEGYFPRSRYTDLPRVTYQRGVPYGSQNTRQPLDIMSDTIQVASLKKRDQQRPVVAARSRKQDGWFICDGPASSLFVRDQESKGELAPFNNRDEWIKAGYRAPKQGGIMGLGRKVSEVREEFERRFAILARKLPYQLGAMALVVDGELSYQRQDLGIWRKFDHNMNNEWLTGVDGQNLPEPRPEVSRIALLRGGYKRIAYKDWRHGWPRF